VLRADLLAVETIRQVECLNCGYRRAIRSNEERSALEECPKCRYVGWAASAELSEETRRLLRERPVPSRRLHAV
jgi:Zn ribbon nucleic-acid-binding protein